jgi:hypothetical protein
MATSKDIDTAERTLRDQLRKVRAAKKGLPPDGSIVETQADLARCFKVERSTIHTWAQKGMPGEPGRYIVADVEAWRKAQQDDDALLSSSAPSPWLEELRKNKALQEEIKLGLMRESVVEIDRMRDCWAVWTSIIRRMQDRIGKQFGRDAESIVSDALDDCERSVAPLFKALNGDGDITSETEDAAATTAAPAKPTRKSHQKHKAAEPKVNKRVGRKRTDTSERTVQRRTIQAPPARSEPVVVRGFGCTVLE